MEKPVHARVPRKCQYDGTEMGDTKNGARCPTCGHEVFDEEFDFFGAGESTAPPAACQCARCTG